MFFRRISCISSSKRLHACITPNFPLLCCMNFRTVLHARWGFSNEMFSSLIVTVSSLLSTGSLLLNISSAISSNEKDPSVSRCSSSSRKSDSSIFSFSCIFSSAAKLPRSPTVQHHLAQFGTPLQSTWPSWNSFWSWTRWPAPKYTGQRVEHRAMWTRTPFPRPWPRAGDAAESSCSGVWGSLWFPDLLVENWLSCWVKRRPVGCCPAGAQEDGHRSYRDRAALCVLAGRVVCLTHATRLQKASRSSTPSSLPCTWWESPCSWRHGVSWICRSPEEATSRCHSYLPLPEE